MLLTVDNGQSPELAGPGDSQRTKTSEIVERKLAKLTDNFISWLAGNFIPGKLAIFQNYTDASRQVF